LQKGRTGMTSDGMSFLDNASVSSRFNVYDEGHIIYSQHQEDVEEHHRSKGSYVHQLENRAAITTPFPNRLIDLRAQRTRVLRASLPGCTTLSQLPSFLSDYKGKRSLVMGFDTETLVRLFDISNDRHIGSPAVIPVLIEVVSTRNNLPIDVCVQIVSSTRIGDNDWLRSDYASASVAGRPSSRHTFCIDGRSDFTSYQSCEGGGLPIWHASNRVNTAYFCAYATVDFDALAEQIREKTDGGYVSIRVREDPLVEDVLQYFLLTEAEYILAKYERRNRALDSSDFLTQEGSNTMLSLPAAEVNERLEEISAACMLPRNVMNLDNLRVVISPVNGCSWDQVVEHEHRHATAGVGVKELSNGTELRLGISLRVTAAQRSVVKRTLVSKMRME
jgi:hypothetical protein